MSALDIWTLTPRRDPMRDPARVLRHAHEAQEDALALLASGNVHLARVRRNDAATLMRLFRALPCADSAAMTALP